MERGLRHRAFRTESGRDWNSRRVFLERRLTAEGNEANGYVLFLVTTYCSQKLKEMSLAGFQSADAERKGAILGALALYLDFVNLFLMLLRLFGRRK